MSLINEALKKAQAQRQGQSPAARPSDGSPSTPRPMAPAGGTSAMPAQRPAHLWPVVAAFVGVAVLFAAGAGLIVWGLMRPAEAPVSAEVAGAMGEGPGATTQEGASSPIDSAAPSPAEPGPAPIEFKLPPEPVRSPAATVPATAAAAATPAPVPVATQGTTAAAAEAPSGMPPAPASPDPNPSVDAFLARLEVRGVMTGGRKVLIFNHITMRSQAYEPGATVSNELQLKIREISERSLTFVDHDGHVYTKQF